jgi:hypothetical protein
MLSKFKLQTLKQKLWAIVAASFVARVIMFFVLPNTPSSLAPDEGTYASLSKWIGESKPAHEFPAYGKGLYLSGRTMIVPASALYRVGFNELDSVRLVASAYGFCALVLVVLMTLKIYRQYFAKDTHRAWNENIVAGIILVFAFLPSHFLWSNLGLRESATEFWLITAFITFFVIFHQEKTTILSLLLLMGSIGFTFSARPQVGWVLGVALVVFLVFNLRQVRSYFILPVVLSAVVLGGALSAGSALSTSSPTSASASILARVLNPLLMAGEIVDYKQEANQVGAASVIQVQSCPRETPSFVPSSPTKFDTYFCIAWRAPYMVSTFLFRPIIGVDVTSRSSLFAAFENLVWISFFLTIFGLLIWRRTIDFLGPLLPALIFLALYVLGASAYQGNMGTGFRHKSLILWAVLLVVYALAWRKPTDLGETTRNNSQESAV